MNSACAKTVLIPLVLAATWATAQADAMLTTTLTPPSAVGTVDHVRVFAEDYTPSNYNLGTSVQDPPGTYIPGSAVLSQDLGSVVGLATLTGNTTVAYAAGTSAYAGLVGTIGSNQLFFSSNGVNNTNANHYLSSGTSFVDLFNAIVNGNTTPLFALYGNEETTSNNPPNGLTLTNFDPGATSTQSLSMYVFTRASDGMVTSSTQLVNSGTLNVTPLATPEPASLAALGAGALALLRRRRRLASCPSSPSA